MRSAIRATLVGEDNPHSSRSDLALYPHPANCAGERLQRLVLGVSIKEYLLEFSRVNLCQKRWSLREARETASQIKALGHHEPLVLLGAKVCQAFGVPYIPFVLIPWAFNGVPPKRDVVVLPHPSGRCRAWNEPGAFERARLVLTEAGILETS